MNDASLIWYLLMIDLILGFLFLSQSKMLKIIALPIYNPRNNPIMPKTPCCVSWNLMIDWLELIKTNLTVSRQTK